MLGGGKKKSKYASYPSGGDYSNKALVSILMESEFIS